MTVSIRAPRVGGDSCILFYCQRTRNLRAHANPSPQRRRTSASPAQLSDCSRNSLAYEIREPAEECPRTTGSRALLEY